MDVRDALEIVKKLADGKNPFTGEDLPQDSVYQHPQVVRALFAVVEALEAGGKSSRRRTDLPGNAGAAWTAEEDERLSRAFDAGGSVEDLMTTHQRTRGAIHARLVKLGKIAPGKPEQENT
jgi:hypothetical protein